ncbi:hypothetical protein A8M77_32980 [Variovorax sp. JS1663]|nr:hypothetical protein A8M77_32980 [Variovorax sp. JS1663]
MFLAGPVFVRPAAQSVLCPLPLQGGDLGKVLKELGSSEGIKAIVTSMLTAGAIQGLSTSGLLPENLANATNGSGRFTDQLQRQLIDGVVPRDAACQVVDVVGRDQHRLASGQMVSLVSCAICLLGRHSVGNDCWAKTRQQQWI